MKIFIRTDSRRALPYLLVSFVNLYFPVSYWFRGIIEDYYPIPIFKLTNVPYSLLDAVILLICFIMLVAGSKISIDYEKEKRLPGISDRIIILCSFVIYIVTLMYFKYIGAGYSYEGFHKMLNNSLTGKFQYLLYLALSIQIYYVIKFNDKFLVKILSVQLLFGVLFSEMRSFVFFQMVTLSLIPMVTEFILKNKTKALVILSASMLLPIMLRSNVENDYFVLAQIFSTGAFQYDLLVLGLQGEILSISSDYASSGGGYGSFFPRELYDFIGFYGIFLWAFLPLVFLFLPTTLSCTLAIYYFTIVRNNYGSWLNGYLAIILVIFFMILLEYISKKNKRFVSEDKNFT